MDEIFDVAVIGGGAAGLSAAVALLRSRRKVLVVDAGDPRNAPAGHVHNFLTRDGTAPGDLYAAGRAEIQAYGGTLTHATVTGVARDGELFRVAIDDRTVAARRILLATGARDELPDIAGLAQRWGIDVLHCPYCHGWEVRDQRIGELVLAPGLETEAYRALAKGRTLPALTRQLADLGISVIDGQLEALVEEWTTLGLTFREDSTHLALATGLRW